MLLAGLAVSICLAPVRLAETPAAAGVPRLEVLQGTVRVLAGEGWLALAAGDALPEPLATASLRLDWDSRARLSTPGATLEIRGPLEVVSDAVGPWRLSVEGGGALRLDVRSTPVEVELLSSARLELPRGVYWAEAVSTGDWRVGCDAGEALLLHPPGGLRWQASPRIASGASARLVPARFAGPASPLAGGVVAAAPWSRFSWPWK